MSQDKTEVKVYRGREGHITSTGHWVDSGFSEGEPDNKGQERPFLALVEKPDYDALSSANTLLRQQLEKFITKSNGLSFFAREINSRFLLRTQMNDLLEKLDNLYEYQCEVETALKRLEK